MPRIELNGEEEPVWLTPHLRDPQPERERDRSFVQMVQNNLDSNSLSWTERVDLAKN